VSSSPRALFPCALLAALAVGLFLQWPSLQVGFRGDDYVQHAMFRGDFPSPRSAFDLFSFASGTRADYQRLVDFGHLPWWAHPQLRLRMWRPLASALMALDFTLFDTRAQLHHVHSLLWFGLLLWAAGRLLFRVLPGPAAALALVMYATGPCHTLPVGWLANRSTIVGSALAFFAIDVLVAGGERASRLRRWACATLTATALLCGEYAVATIAYGLAFAWLGTPGADRRRQLQTSLPVLAPLLGYLLLHTLVGSDIVHSGYYISPFGAPLSFAHAVVTRVPVLVADMLLGLPSYQFSSGTPLRDVVLSWQLFTPQVWAHLPDWPTWHTLIGYLAIALAVLQLRATRARAPALTWLCAGSALSLIPCAGSLPEDRLLVASTLGAYALVACVLTSLPRAFAERARKRERFGYAFLAAFAAWVAISSASRSHDDVRSIRAGSELARTWCLDADMPDATTAHVARVYLLSHADFNTAVNLPWLRLLEQNQPVPLSYRRLSAGPMPIDVIRTGDRVLELSVITRAVFGSAVPSLYRDASSPVRRGEQHTLPGLRVTVLDVLDGNPSRTRFEFDRSVDDPRLWFLVSGEHGLRRQTMPPVGKTLRLMFAYYGDIQP
jgi:hypothetical protein